ncbi:uncharacterized protein BKA55DRAFT_562009 [Fusarium redolens]|jgi:hypothetical protein|uniref:Uncharacterized protein n=1 Tax=Fusarium redolens TaxID=48865 RepID=A0A9P9KJ47_FUSRE|nr:uncharacterized protein BKA55DRAFT_562009 [Fusarium redolens]KAH7259065.1 hypothetical protein BKA55DRAFT_562009 [Fusarium redolens]
MIVRRDVWCRRLFLALLLNVVPLLALGALALVVLLGVNLAGVVADALALGVIPGSMLAAVVKNAASFDISGLGVGVGDGSDCAHGEKSAEESLVQKHDEGLSW